MKSYENTTYQLEEKDLLCATKFADGSVALHYPGYVDPSNRGFRIDFLPRHIPHLEHLIELLKGAALLGLLSLTLWSSPAAASPSQDWCPTLIAQATSMLEHQTDSDLTGKIVVPASIAREDTRAYRKLIRRGRSLLRRYHDHMPVVTILNVLKSDCEDVYNPTRNGTH